MSSEEILENLQQYVGGDLEREIIPPRTKGPIPAHIGRGRIKFISLKGGQFTFEFAWYAKLTGRVLTTHFDLSPEHWQLDTSVTELSFQFSSIKSSRTGFGRRSIRHYNRDGEVWHLYHPQVSHLLLLSQIQTPPIEKEE